MRALAEYEEVRISWRLMDKNTREQRMWSELREDVYSHPRNGRRWRTLVKDEENVVVLACYSDDASHAGGEFKKNLYISTLP